MPDSIKYITEYEAYLTILNITLEQNVNQTGINKKDQKRLCIQTKNLWS